MHGKLSAALYAGPDHDAEARVAGAEIGPGACRTAAPESPGRFRSGPVVLSAIGCDRMRLRGGGHAAAPVLAAVLARACLDGPRSA